MQSGAILFAGDFWFGASDFGLAQGFRRLGIEVHELTAARFLVGYQNIALKPLARMVNNIGVREYNKEIIGSARQLKPSIFITVKGNYVKPSTLNFLNKAGIKTVNFYPDFRFTYASIDQSTFPLYSLFVTTKSFHLPYLKQQLGAEKVRFLHHGYSSDVHQPPLSEAPRSRESVDILYVGTYTKAKENWLSGVRNRFPKLNIQIFGHGWKHAVTDKALASCIQGRAIYGMNYAWAVNQAKINLAIHMGAADKTGWEDLVSTRTFEIPACKGFMLHVDNEEVRQLYMPGEEIDVFGNEESLYQQIDFYLNNPEMRERMIERAYKKCVPAYSYDARAATLRDWIFEVDNEPK